MLPAANLLMDSEQCKRTFARLQSLQTLKPLSDTEAKAVTEKTSQSQFVPDTELAAWLLWASAQDKDVQESVINLWRHCWTHTAAMHLFHYWQNHFEDSRFCDFCRRLLICTEKTAEWVLFWEKILAFSNPAIYLAKQGNLARENSRQSLWDYLKSHWILPHSGIGQKATALCYCFGDARILNDDRLLCEVVRRLSAYEKTLFLRNLLREYPLFLPNSVLLPEHSQYTERLRHCMELLCAALPDDSAAGLIRNYLAANALPNPEHADFWENRFLQNIHPLRRLGYFSYSYQPEQCALIVRGPCVEISDVYSSEIITVKENASAVTLTENWQEALIARFKHKPINYPIKKTGKGESIMKCTKIVITYPDESQEYNFLNRIIYEGADFLSGTLFLLPKLPDKAKMTFCTSEDTEIQSLEFKTFCALIRNSFSDISNKELIAAEMVRKTGVLPSINEGALTEIVPPSISVTDVTEKMLLGLPALTMEFLDGKNSGLWTFSGERILRIAVRSIPDQSFGEWKAALKFTGIEQATDIEFLFADTVPAGDQSTFLCKIDTDVIGKNIQGSSYANRNRVAVTACFSLTRKNSAGEIAEESFEFIFNLFFYNTWSNDAQNPHLCMNTGYDIAIDFGTSSTCAAIGAAAVSMIEMTPDTDGSESARVYENPTLLMIRNWDTLSEKWHIDKRMALLSFVNSGKEYGELNDPSFDCGHNVNAQIDTELTQRTLDAVISDLKMLPLEEDRGYVRECLPYDRGSRRSIELRCKEKIPIYWNAEDSFDPIAFYAYLLGRAINHPNSENNQFYMHYQLTFPVKYDEQQRERIRQSVENGLRRSVPSRALQLKDGNGNSLFRVDMPYAEPVACLGACCSYELQLGENGEPRLFGLFDFGGGTADFAYGIYRGADEETEGYDQALEIFGTDGNETGGGEFLIRKITYWVLTDQRNKETVINNAICFTMPDDMPKPDGFGNLINQSATAQANTRFLNDVFSRPFFTQGNYYKIAEIDHYNEDDADIPIKLTFPEQLSKEEVELVVNHAELKAKLEKELNRLCELFIKGMRHTFALESFRKRLAELGMQYSEDAVSDISIILTGNASRHRYIREKFEQQFPGQVFLVGENRPDTGGMHYKVTPKTAVALGLLQLSEIKVKMPEDRTEQNDQFMYYVARRKTGRLLCLLERNADNSAWKLVGPIKSNSVTVYTSFVGDTENLHCWNNAQLSFRARNDGKEYICYIRGKGRRTIEYVAVPNGQKPTADTEPEGTYEIDKIAKEEES